MNKKARDLVNKNISTNFGKIKLKDISFYNDFETLKNNQQIVLTMINDNINRKILEANIERCNSYHSNIIWLFDKNTVILDQTTKNTEHTYKVILVLFTLIISFALFVILYKKYNLIGIGIITIAIVSLIGFYIVYKKLHLFNKKKTKDEKELEVVENNKLDFIKFFNLVQEIYDFDIFMITYKKTIRDTIKIFNNILVRPDGLRRLNSDANKYSKMLTKILEYIGMLDIFISITKLVLFDKYVLPEFIESPKPYLEFVGDTFMKFTDQNILYAVGNFEKRNAYIETLLENIYLCQSIGISNFAKIKYTPFHSIIDQELTEIYNVNEIIEKNSNKKYLVVLTESREMNHYFIQQLQRTVKFNNIILILSFKDVIKDLEIDKYIIKEFK